MSTIKEIKIFIDDSKTVFLSKSIVYSDGEVIVDSNYHITNVNSATYVNLEIDEFPISIKIIPSCCFMFDTKTDIHIQLVNKSEKDRVFSIASNDTQYKCKARSEISLSPLNA